MPQSTGMKTFSLSASLDGRTRKISINSPAGVRKVIQNAAAAWRSNSVVHKPPTKAISVPQPYQHNRIIKLRKMTGRRWSCRQTDMTYGSKLRIEELINKTTITNEAAQIKTVIF